MVLADMLNSQPSSLLLINCINTCCGNFYFMSIKYNTSLGILLSSSSYEAAGRLILLLVPVFNIYMQCLFSASSCNTA